VFENAPDLAGSLDGSRELLIKLLYMEPQLQDAVSLRDRSWKQGFLNGDNTRRYLLPATADGVGHPLRRP
jgi:hypothetical protein